MQSISAAQNSIYAHTLCGVQMMGDLGVTDDPKKVGYYSGLTVGLVCNLLSNEMLRKTAGQHVLVCPVIYLSQNWNARRSDHFTFKEAGVVR